MQIAINNKKLVQDCSIEIANIHSLLSFSLFLVCTLGSEREEKSACTWEWRPLRQLKRIKAVAKPLQQQSAFTAVTVGGAIGRD